MPHLSPISWIILILSISTLIIILTAASNTSNKSSLPYLSTKSSLVPAHPWKW